MMKPKGQTEHETGLLEYLEDIIGTDKYIPLLEESAKRCGGRGGGGPWRESSASVEAERWRRLGWASPRGRGAGSDAGAGGDWVDSNAILGTQKGC